MNARDVSAGGRGARLAVAVLALSCLATGALVGRLFGDGPGRSPSYLSQLVDSLDLRPDQVAAFESVLAEEDREIDTLLHGKLKELDAPIAARRRKTESALIALLDAPQRAHYEELLHGGAADGERGR